MRYTTPNYEDGGIWVKKAPVLRDLVEGNPYAEFCEEVVPKAGEPIITKQYASAFFGTSLVATLNGMRRGHADHHRLHDVRLHTRYRGGCCPARLYSDLRSRVHWRPSRRSARSESLFDINAKYGDVISKAEAMEYLQGL